MLLLLLGIAILYLIFFCKKSKLLERFEKGKYESDTAEGLDADNIGALHKTNKIGCTDDDGTLQTIKMVQVNKDSTDKAKYRFTCNKAIKGTSDLTKNTTYDTKGDGIHYLDRHTLSCDDSSVLKDFTLKYDTSSGNVRYDYTCRVLDDATAEKMTCRSINTPEITLDQGNVTSLKDLYIACDSGESLGGFSLERNGGDKIYYNYKCCKLGEQETFEPREETEDEYMCKRRH